MGLAAKAPVEALLITSSMAESVISAVQKTFADLFSSNVKVIQVDRSPQGRNYQREITGVAGFIESHLHGTIAVAFTKSNLVQIASKFYGQKLDSLDDKAIESLGELTNVIHGIVRRDLNWQGHSFGMCLPIVILGKNHTVFSSMPGDTLVIQFEIENSSVEFYVEVNVYPLVEK